MEICFFMPKQCLVYLGILLYIIIAILVTRYERKRVVKYWLDEPICTSAILGTVWPILLIGALLNGIFTGLGWLLTLGIEQKEKSRF